ncbi:polysaccharide biosynthesis tyrosine autokinase [Nocardioides seonyuensis]|uniref:Polysaccharide biosynthesis tyrosine autokinase n=1 Tax=Nocardioides seonyuensis TaxID=2518371 RepID=A0A4P7IGE9_9ACTN|nr:polysaccharide biosynthesis tyrosine autokinase [Nocardioides seonyuensis]QBX55840.1 polysaccharide biosynthesis tyrosine autokinase [Nocardioides seonyuensis]
MQLADYLRILRNHWRVVAACVVAMAVLAFVWSALQTKVYSASSSGFVTAGETDQPGLGTMNDSLSKSRAASYVVLAKDRKTASLVIDDLGLETTPESLVSNISASQTPDTVIISITARAATAKGAQALADAWVRALAERVAEIEPPGEGAMRIEVSESAQLPTRPIAPNVPRNILFGAILGALLGAGYAMARNVLDRKVRTAEDVERWSDVAVVGTIPEIPEAGIFVTETGVSIEAIAAEALRRVRTNLSFMDVDNPPRAIVVTSPKQGDGKSTMAANLAAAIALSGQHVTLIDADLRRPNVAPLLKLDDAVGLTDVLTHRLNLADAIQLHPTIDRLMILTSGSRPPNPSEILGSKTMKAVVNELSKHGMVILDAPPLLPVTDAAILAHSTDGALVTVSAGRTLDTDLMTAIDSLLAVHARPLGVILNRVSRRNVGSGNFAAYGYAPDAYVQEAAAAGSGDHAPRGGRRKR